MGDVVDVSRPHDLETTYLTEEELVSSDFKGDPMSSTFDSKLTKVVGNTAKVIAWYDNEWGYSSRVKDLILFLVKKGL